MEDCKEVVTVSKIFHDVLKAKIYILECAAMSAMRRVAQFCPSSQQEAQYLMIYATLQYIYRNGVSRR